MAIISDPYDEYGNLLPFSFMGRAMAEDKHELKWIDKDGKDDFDLWAEELGWQ